MMKDDLVEKVARALLDCADEDGDEYLSGALFYTREACADALARAIIPVVLEEAAGVAESYRSAVFPGRPSQIDIAQAIRSLGDSE